MAAPFTDEEITSLRALTSGCTDEMVHLNHAGASLPPDIVVDTQVSHLRREARIGGYEAASESAAREDAVYESVASMINAAPSEIARSGSASEAWSSAFWSIPMERGQRVLMHDHEYGANAVSFIHAAKTRGVVVERVASDASGKVSVDAMASALALADDVALVSLTHVPTNGGLVNPAAAIGGLARSANVPYLVDACQSVGQLDLDVDDIGCDFLSATGRKYLRGPRGTAFLYARTSILDRVTPSQPDHWAAEWTSVDDYVFADGARRFEHWEFDHAGWLGLGAAVDHAMEWGIDRIEATVAERADQLRVMLADIGMAVYDQGVQKCGIVTAAFPGTASADLQSELSRRGINTSVTTVGSSRYDVERRALPPLLRLSVHCTTTLEELERTLTTLRKLLP